MPFGGGLVVEPRVAQVHWLRACAASSWFLWWVGGSGGGGGRPMYGFGSRWGVGYDDLIGHGADLW